MMTVRCSAGVSPAIFPTSTQRKITGQVPAPWKAAFLREVAARKLEHKIPWPAHYLRDLPSNPQQEDLLKRNPSFKIGRNSPTTCRTMLCPDLAEGLTPFVEALPICISTDSQMTLSYALEAVRLNRCTDMQYAE